MTANGSGDALLAAGPFLSSALGAVHPERRGFDRRSRGSADSASGLETS